MSNDCEYDHEIIKVGDKVRYLPTGTIFLVKEIYSDGAVGNFDLPAGPLKERRAVIIPANESGHYSIGEDIAKICSKCGKEIHQSELQEKDDKWMRMVQIQEYPKSRYGSVCRGYATYCGVLSSMVWYGLLKRR